MNKRIGLVLLIMVVACSIIRAASGDTIKYPLTFKLDPYQFANGTKTIYRDTLLDQLQSYKPYGNLGNNGLPVNDYMMDVKTYDAGFRYNINNYDRYMANPQRLSYYNTRSPYTNLFFLIGVKKELMFDMVHTQNVNRNLNMALTFKRIRSDGFYNRQNTNDNVFTYSANYRAPKGRYALLSNVVLNSMQYAESGGISNEFLFETAFVNNRKLMGVNLSSAQTKYRQRAFFLKQYLNFGNYIDSVKVNDSTYQKKIIPSFALSHQFLIDDHSWNYKDQSPTSGYYPTIYQDSSLTNDSTWFMHIQNQVSVHLLKNKMNGQYRPITAEVGIKHEMIKLWRDFADTNLNNFIAFADVRTWFKGIKLAVDVNMQYVMSGNNSGNYLLKLDVKKVLGDSTFLIGAMRQEEKRGADWQMRYYSSNNFRWNNVFDDFSVSTTELYIASPKYKFKFSARMDSYVDPIYYDTLALPAQRKGTINVVGGYFQKHLTLWKLHLVTNTGYRYLPYGDVIRMPQFISLNSLYLQGYLFKKAMFTQFGFDVSYFSGYYSNAYMPATGQFYFQKSKKIGDYPVIDVFFNAKVSSARIFIKYEHVSSALFGLNYYAAPGYPIPDRGLKFGINWTFGD